MWWATSDVNNLNSKIMDAVTLSEARVYVGTYNKYNNGSLFGKWLDLSDYSGKDEFLEACRELHEDEQDPELMFQDIENIPEALISESWLSDKFFEFRDAIEKLSETQQEAFFVWCDHHNSDISEKMRTTLFLLLRTNIRENIKTRKITHMKS